MLGYCLSVPLTISAGATERQYLLRRPIVITIIVAVIMVIIKLLALQPIARYLLGVFQPICER